MRIIIHWMGTDALTLITNPPGRLVWHLKLILYRLKWKLLHRAVHEHWVVHVRLKKYLMNFGVPKHKIKKRIMPPICVFERKPHEGFNVLYYCPTKPPGIMGMKYMHWVYGYDVYLKVKHSFKANEDINFIHVGGGETIEEMERIWEITDFYLRPNRHDGMPRMVLEARREKIPYYWDQGFRPLTSEILKIIAREYMKQKEERSHGE